MGFLDRVAGQGLRADRSLPFDEFISYFNYGGLAYPYSLNQTLVDGKTERPPSNYGGLVNMGYKQNGIIFAILLARMSLFCEARFQYRRRQNGRPGDLWGDDSLRILEKPWRNGTTCDLLASAELDASLAGNFYGALRLNPKDKAQRDPVKYPPAIRRLRPDWVSIVLGSDDDPEVDGYDIDAEIVGYLYHAGGYGVDTDPTPLLPEEVCHYAPIPDPLAPYRGMSWLGPVVSEILADKAATSHKLKFFENGATPSMVAKLPEPDPEKFQQWVRIFREDNEGSRNAYRTLFLGAGADVSVVGANLQQINFRDVQAYGETRLAAAGGTPPQVIGLAESMGGNALNGLTYAAAIKRFADLTIRPNWRNFAGSMETLVPPPPSNELWYDDRDIPALQEDVKAAADVRAQDAVAMNTLIMAGYTADSVRDAVTSGDLTILEHSGLTSVQMHAPGQGEQDAALAYLARRKALLEGNGHGSHEVAEAALATMLEKEA